MDDQITTEHYLKIDLSKKVFNMETMIQWDHLNKIVPVYSHQQHRIDQISILQTQIIRHIHNLIRVATVVQVDSAIDRMTMMITNLLKNQISLSQTLLSQLHHFILINQLTPHLVKHAHR